MKVFKWVFGLFAAIGGILAIMLVPGGNRKKRIKEIKKETKEIDNRIKEKETKQKNIKKNIKTKKENLKKTKSKKYVKKDVTTKEASNFLKDFAKKKGKK